MANLPVELEAARRRSWLAMFVAGLLIGGSWPAIRAQLSSPAEVAEAIAPTTTVDPAAVGVRRLDADSSLDFEDPELGSVGFRTGAVVVVLTPANVMVADLDRDVVGLVERSTIGTLVGPLDHLGRTEAIAETPDGLFSIDNAGVVRALGRVTKPRVELRHEAEPLCDDPCDRVVVRPGDGGAWTAVFSRPLAPDRPPLVVSPGGDAVAGWIDGEAGLRLEIATPHETMVVPFSNEGSGPPVMTAWVPEGDGIVYVRQGEARLQVYSASRQATGTVWLDDVVEGAALLPARRG